MKLSNENLKNIIDKCTKKEIDLIIHIGQYQDDFGVIRGIHYKDILEAIKVSKSGFYQLIHSLEKKKIIEVNYLGVDYSFWEITLLNNVFACEEDYKKGYLKLNFSVLHSENFVNMTKSEKVIVLNILRINDYCEVKIKLTIHRLMGWTGKSRRSVMKFMDVLSKTFKITKKDNLFLIDCLWGLRTRPESESATKLNHIVQYRLKKNKTKSKESAIKDAITVFEQYKIKCVDTVIALLDDTLKKFGAIRPKYLNKQASLAAARATCLFGEANPRFGYGECRLN